MRRLTAALVSAALVCAVAYLGMSALILEQALRGVREPGGSTPLLEGIPGAEALSLTTSDEVRIAAWFLPTAAARKARRAIVLVHGLNSRGWSGYHKDAARAYLEAGFDVVVFDLRAQGESGGDRLGLGWHERLDVRAVVDELVRRGFSPGSIGLHGSSYGGGTALMATSQIAEIGAVLVDCPWADVRPMMGDELQRKTGFGPLWIPGVTLWGRALYGLDLDEHEPVLHVREIAPRPVFFVVGEADERIPPSHTTSLFDAARAPKEQWRLPGVGHTDGWSRQPEEFRARAVAFFGQHLR